MVDVWFLTTNQRQMIRVNPLGMGVWLYGSQLLINVILLLSISFSDSALNVKPGKSSIFVFINYLTFNPTLVDCITYLQTVMMVSYVFLVNGEHGKEHVE